MEKTKIHIEYMFNTISCAVLWNAISTAAGMEKWFADEVTCENRLYTFRWGKSETKQAELINIRTNSFIRFHWIDDEESKSYFEFRIEQNELTGDYTFVLTDFAEEDEIDDLKDLWNSEIEALQRFCGFQ